MLKNFYENIVLKYPLIVLIATILMVFLLGINAKKLEIDASADTLLLENDKDLKYSRIINQRYNNKDFLLIAFSVKDDLLSQSNLQTIADITKELEKLPPVTGVTSILNVPLLHSSQKELQDLVDGVPTLQNSNIDKTLVKQEFLTSPLYKDALVSSDFQTTTILVSLKTNKKYFELIKQKEELERKQKDGNFTKEDEEKLKNVNLEYKNVKLAQRELEHNTIKDVRSIMAKYEPKADMFLGGVNMIVDDIISYVRNDLYIYGFGLLVVLVILLWVIFGEIRWIGISIFIALLSVVSTTGILGIFGWNITVISSNFVSLQLIITLSIILHLIVQYKEEVSKNQNATQKELVLNTVLAKFKPSLFAIMTTIAGFSSLVVSQIRPVINLGLMMSLGIAVSLFIAFLLFPVLLMFMNKSKSNKNFGTKYFPITKISAQLVLKYGNQIIVIFVIIFAISLYYSSKLVVENSFISYFKKSTPIYQGMEMIDQKLGGTTPLDIVIDFKELQEEKKENSNNDFLDEFEAEFEEDENNEEYWFTQNKMETIAKVHSYLKSLEEIGDVQSFYTLLQIGKTLNNNKNLDSILLALLYSNLPNNYKELIISPYINIENNQARITTRIIDSNENLRRDELLKKIDMDLKELLKNDNVEVHQTGLMVLYNNMLQSLFSSQIATLGIVLIMLFIMFMILFKSIKVAFIALIVNIVPVSVVFGIMGFVNIPLNIMTIIIAAITIGIGVDDTIHYIERFKKEFYICKDYIEAMEKSHDSIGYAMYYTSLTIILGFSILIFSNFIPTIYFGLLTVVVMIIVLVADLLLLPRLLILLKPFNK